MDFMKEAISQNRHWETNEVVIPRIDPPLIEREAFSVLEQSAQSKFVVILRGLRRVGKSVMARQLLQKMMLSGSKPSELCWFEFDRAMGTTTDDLDSLIKFFQSRGAKTIIFDELAFVKGWQDIIKRYYDRTEIKLIVTGSSALELDRRSAESLAGRFRLIAVKPFSFKEFLLLKGYSIPKTALELVDQAENAIIKCNDYVHSGGLPEAVRMKAEERKSYVKDSLLNPLFFKDIPSVFPSANPDLLLKTLELLSATVGSTFQFQTLAQILGCTHPTVSAQVEILTRGLLARPLFNHTGSLVKQKRTSKKIVISDNAIVSTLNSEIRVGALAENLVAETSEAEYFWRDAEGREVDFIFPKKKLAIEVKYQNTISSEDEKNLRYFIERRKGWKGILITKNDESKGDIPHVPLWKWLLGSRKA